MKFLDDLRYTIQMARREGDRRASKFESILEAKAEEKSLDAMEKRAADQVKSAVADELEMHKELEERFDDVPPPSKQDGS
jgi:hypothetical protein